MWHSRFSLRFISALSLSLAVAAFSPAQENNNVRSVRISHVEGTVQLLGSDGVAFDQAHANMPVTQGMRLKTGEDGRVEVQFEDGSVARATPNSTLSFDQLQRTSEGQTVTQMIAEGGLTYFELNNRGGTYTVHFGPYTATATKSSLFRIDLDENPAQLAVLRGDVHVETGNANGLDLSKNQTATLHMDDAASYDVAQNVATDSWDQWNSDRDKVLEKMGSRATMARAMGGNPDDPAWSDLDYYGSWYNMPGYGMGWMPAGVGAGWDPYGSGYWGYYPSYGYSWISGYSWGWLPYRCGGWNWFNNTGWMWFPGNCGWGSGWYPTTVWNTPPNYVLPLRPKQPVTPARGPVHMPPQQALIPVNRNPASGPVSPVDGKRPVATPIRLDGKTIHPVETSVRIHNSGPLGQGFRASSGYEPQSGVTGTRASGPVAPGNTNTGAAPARGSAPAAGARPMPSGGGSPRMSAPPPSSPRMSAPPPAAPRMSAPPAMSAPRMSAPPPSAPSGGARPH